MNYQFIISSLVSFSIIFFIFQKIIFKKFYIFSIINIIILIQAIVHHFIPFYLKHYQGINFYKKISFSNSDDINIIILCSILSVILFTYTCIVNINHTYVSKNQTLLNNLNMNKYLINLIVILGFSQILIFIGILPFPYVPIDEWTKLFYQIDYDYWLFYNPIHLGNIDNYFIKHLFITLSSIIIPFSIVLFCLKFKDQRKIQILIYFLILLFFLSTNQRTFVIGSIFPAIAILYLIEKLCLKNIVKMSLVLLIVYVLSPLIRDNATQNLSNSFFERSIITINGISNIICDYHINESKKSNKNCDIFPSKRADFIRSIEEKHDVNFESFNPVHYTFSKRTDANLFSNNIHTWNINQKVINNSFSNIEFIITNIKYLLPGFIFDKTQTYKPIGSYHEYFLSDPSSYLLLSNNLPPTDFIRSLIIDMNLISGNILVFILFIILLFYIHQKIESKIVKNATYPIVILFIGILHAMLVDFNVTDLLVSIRNCLIIIFAFKILNIIFNYLSSKIVNE